MFPPFSFYVFVYVVTYLNRYFLLDEGLERLFYFTGTLVGTPPSPERSWQRGLGLWDLCGIALCVLSALKLDFSSV